MAIRRSKPFRNAIGIQLDLGAQWPRWVIREHGGDSGEGEGLIVWAPDRESAIRESGFQPEQIEYCELHPDNFE